MPIDWHAGLAEIHFENPESHKRQSLRRYRFKLLSQLLRCSASFCAFLFLPSSLWTSIQTIAFMHLKLGAFLPPAVPKLKNSVSCVRHCCFKLSMVRDYNILGDKSRDVIRSVNSRSYERMERKFHHKYRILIVNHSRLREPTRVSSQTTP